MKIKNDINPNYSLVKSTIDTKEANDFKSVSTKLDENEYGYIYPPVHQGVTDFVLKNNGRLRKCTDVLAQDTILQDYIYKDSEGNNIIEEDVHFFWNKKNKFNLYLAVMERYQYGFGVCEILMDSKGQPYELVQIPAKTMVIQKDNTHYENGEVVPIYYAVQMEFNSAIKRFRIHNLLDTYPESDDNLNIVLWLGGGTTHRFYDIPVWYSDTDKLLGQINLNVLTAQQINNGNNISGVLNISGPPQRPNEQGITVEEQLRRQMNETGTGILVSYLESPNRDFPLNFEFIPISNNNWEYLEQFSKTADDAVMSNYSIPKVRLMIDDTKESMNSNKSDTIWQIYAISLNYEQFPNELIIQEFNKIFFNKDYEVDMQIPIFSDKKQIELTTVKDLFNSGLLTLGQAISKISEFYPELHIEIVDENNPLFNERYFNGNALGFNNYVNSQPLDEAKNILEMFGGNNLSPIDTIETFKDNNPEQTIQNTMGLFESNENNNEKILEMFKE